MKKWTREAQGFKSQQNKTARLVEADRVTAVACAKHFLNQTLSVVCLTACLSSSAIAQQAVESFTLINADTDLPIAAFDPLLDGAEIDLALLPTNNLNIRANTSPAVVGSVQFDLDGSINYQTESVAPYALEGDSNGDYNPWTPPLGLRTLTATPFTGSGGGGTAGDALTINFSVVNDPGKFECDPVGAPGYIVSGELRQWHRISITFEGPCSGENEAVNPFTDYRLNVTFTQDDRTVVVPGFFAADGNAGETSADGGNRWRVHFAPDAPGQWSFSASFRTGPNIAVELDPVAGVPDSFDGLSGSINVAASDKTGSDLRAHGLLEYVDNHYFRFATSGTNYIKGGADSPENFLGYFEFDNTFDLGGLSTPGLIDGLHRFEPHVQDWQQGDPTWQGGKGMGIIGAINYLASQGMNSIYFLTFNVAGGDGQDTWIWTTPSERLRVDCSKMDQWEIVFQHMDATGIQLHVVTQETENDQNLDGGSLGLERMLYYRELVARFSHHLAVIWNLGEENTNSVAQRIQFAEYIRAIDPYNHPITVHTLNNAGPAYYNGLYGEPAFEATSLQGNGASYNQWAIDIRNQSAAAGRPWAVFGDEQGPRVDADLGNLDILRTDSLWGNLMGGGAGVEWYYGYQGTFGDVQSEDWRATEPLWQQTRIALDFFHQYLPFSEMTPANELVSNGLCLAKPGEVYAIYRESQGTVTLDLSADANAYEVRWYDTRNGGALQDGSVATVQGPGFVDIGTPPNAMDEDWAALIRLPGASPRILIFSKTSGFRHNSIDDGITMIQDIGVSCGIEVDATEDAEEFTLQNLLQYDAVVFLNTTGDILDASQQTAFEQYIQAGRGYVGIHSASDTEYDWPWYGGLLGNDAWFDNHPAIQTADVLLEDGTAISTSHLDAVWTLNEEWYNFQNNPRPVAQVLLTLDESTYNGGTMGADHPIAWRHEYDGGRSWYTGIGHRSQTYQNEDFIQMIRGAILWSGNITDTPCCTNVSSEPCLQGGVPTTSTWGYALLLLAMSALGSIAFVRRDPTNPRIAASNHA